MWLKAWTLQRQVCRAVWAQKGGRLYPHPDSDVQENHLQLASLFQLPLSHGGLHYGSPCSLPSRQDLGPSFPSQT